jgi:hypothetical protein
MRSRRWIFDEDMAPIHMSMSDAWSEEGVQQCFPSQEGGLRLIQFESPRWRPKATQVRAQLGVQEQHTLKMTPRSHTESVLDVIYMVEREFHIASISTGFRPKFVRSQQESSKEFDVQNLPSCCVTSLSGL